LLRTFKQGRGGIAAPSANKFGHVSPTTAQHVRDEFGGDRNGLLSCVLDGGQSEVGIESTIVDMSRGHAVLLRPGYISAERIAEVLGSVPQPPDAEAPRASGTLESHYAPRTPVALVDAGQLEEIIEKLRAGGRRIALMHYSLRTGSFDGVAMLLPATAAGYAHDMYAALRALDEARADLILVQAPPTAAAWEGVNDRLRRAAHDSAGMLAQLLQR
jgi:L-threonylcarbamoyladenylate synthase